MLPNPSGKISALVQDYEWKLAMLILDNYCVLLVVHFQGEAWFSLAFSVLPSQDAFWALVVLIGSPKYAMHGLLIPGLPKLLAYNDFHGNIRKRFLPKLHKHLVSINWNNVFANECVTMFTCVV